MMTEREAPIGMYQFVNAVEEMIRSADSEKRQALAQTIDAYHGDYPDEFNWATGGQAPALLHNLMLAIDTACRA
jgi:hypothetical protein